MKEESDKLKRSDLLRVIGRSFFIQTTLNFERMQGLGFLRCMIPVIDRLYNDSEGRSLALKRHLEFFNTHPYLSSVVLGVVSSMEEKHSRGEITAEGISTLKNSMMGPFAGIGDSFVWASLRPVIALLGVAIVFLWADLRVGILGPLVFLVLFNLFHLYIRVAGVILGYNYGANIVNRMRGFNFGRLVEEVRVVGLVLLGYITALKIEEIDTKCPAPWFRLCFLGLLIAFVRFRDRFKLSISNLFLLVLLICIVVAYVGLSIC